MSDTEIRFNGVGELGHETFHFLATAVSMDGSGRAFQFCKTNRKPYDEVVMQVLIVLKHYLGETITVTSDGDFDKEWAAARAAVGHVFGIRAIPNEGELERVVN